MADQTFHIRFYDVLSQLRAEHPHGHPDFIPMALDEIRLHSDKNHDYAVGGSALGNFERVPQIMALYPSFPWSTPQGYAIIQVLKQLDAALWQGQSATFHAKVEGMDARWQDIGVYSKIIRCLYKPQTQTENKGGTDPCPSSD